MYFEALPKISYKIGDHQRTVVNILTTIRKRADADDSGVFMDYRIDDGDTPEIVADKVYGHTKWWWVVLIVAGIVRPEQWPVSENDLHALLSRSHGENYTAIWNLVDDIGDPTPQRVRMTFTDENGNTVNWHEHGEGLGAERYGVIHSRGKRQYLIDQAIAANDALREIKVLRPDHLNAFVEDFYSRLNSRVSDGAVDF